MADVPTSVGAADPVLPAPADALAKAREIAARIDQKLRDEGKLTEVVNDDSDVYEVTGAPRKDLEEILTSVDPLKRIQLGAYETIRHEWSIPDSMVGLVIGKGGETIREIGFRTTCDVQIAPHAPPGSNQRPVTLTGSRECISNAIQMMEGILRQSPNSILVPLGSNVETVQIPNMAVGYVIGKGGENIREIQNRSGAKIQVDQFNTSGFTRALTLAGSPEQIQDAKNIINEKLREHEMGRPAGDPDALQYPIHAAAFTFVTGGSGETLRQLAASSGARLQVAPNQMGDVRYIAIAGPDDVKMRARAMIDELVATYGRTSGINVALPAMLPPPPQPQSLLTESAGPAQKFIMSVSNNHVGLLIGKGGETIKHYQDLSLTRIQIDPPTSGDPWRRVSLMGQLSNMEYARQLVEKKIVDSGGQVKYPDDMAQLQAQMAQSAAASAGAVYGGENAQYNQQYAAYYQQQQQQYYQQPGAAMAPVQQQQQQVTAEDISKMTPEQQQAYAQYYAAYYQQYYAQMGQPGGAPVQ